MTKHARKSPRLQAVERPTAATVQIPLPVLGAFASIERSYFDLCIRAGPTGPGRDDGAGPHRAVRPALETRPRPAGGSRGHGAERGHAGWAADSDDAPPRPQSGGAGGRAAQLRVRRAPRPAGCACRERGGLRDLHAEIRAERSTSKSAVSRRYVAMTTTQLTRWLTTPLGDRHFPIVLIDGIVLGDHTVVIALGIDTEGKKQVLGLREGHTEHSRVVKALLRDLVERGLDPERARLFVTDGAKALASTIRPVFGPLAAIQRCQLHKRRNILGHLPEHRHANVTAVLRDAWVAGDAAQAHRQLERLAASLETDHPGAAASVREGLDDTLTLQRFGMAGTLYTKLRTTNAIENLNGGITTYSRNVKRWRSGTMVVRWVSAAIVDAEKKFRRVHGWREITTLVSALGDLEAKEEASTERVA